MLNTTRVPPGAQPGRAPASRPARRSRTPAPHRGEPDADQVGVVAASAAGDDQQRGSRQRQRRRRQPRSRRPLPRTTCPAPRRTRASCRCRPPDADAVRASAAEEQGLITRPWPARASASETGTPWLRPRGSRWTRRVWRRWTIAGGRRGRAPPGTAHRQQDRPPRWARRRRGPAREASPWCPTARPPTTSSRGSTRAVRGRCGGKVAAAVAPRTGSLGPSRPCRGCVVSAARR